MADTKCAVAASVMKPPLSSSAESPSTLLFSPASFLGKADVSGAAVQISNPELSHDSDGHVVFAATIEKPRELMDLSWASVSEETKTTIAKSNEARKEGRKFSVHEQLGRAAVHRDGHGGRIAHWHDDGPSWCEQ